MHELTHGDTTKKLSAQCTPEELAQHDLLPYRLVYSAALLINEARTQAYEMGIDQASPLSNPALLGRHPLVCGVRVGLGRTLDVRLDVLEYKFWPDISEIYYNREWVGWKDSYSQACKFDTLAEAVAWAKLVGTLRHG